MKGKIFNLASSIGIPVFLRKIKGSDITVLSLHRISEERDFFFEPIHPQTFEKLVKYCVAHYEVISFSGIHAKTRKPKLILSFDDGYYDFIEYAVPILQKYNLPSNHNLVNACLNNNTVIWTQRSNDIFNSLKAKNITEDEIIDGIGEAFNGNWLNYHLSFLQGLLKIQRAERDTILDALSAKYDVESKYKMMNWEDAKLCAEKFNVEIGCHTYNHESLLMIQDEASMNMEIGKSIDEMEAMLGRKINILALPNGQYNDSILAYAKKRGIQFTLLVNDELTSRKSLNADFNLINRINLVDEPIRQMILRTECFHSKMRKIV